MASVLSDDSSTILGMFPYQMDHHLSGPIASYAFEEEALEKTLKLRTYMTQVLSNQLSLNSVITEQLVMSWV